jgi:glycosyltransferase involved in cell wall biosynthesis
MNQIALPKQQRKPRVLFVGAFSSPPGKSIRGGQLSACRAILSSPLSECVEWILLDSMMESIPPPPLRRRAWLAAMRTLRFIRHMIMSRIDVAIIFASNEMSLVEKGVMVIVAKTFGKRVIFCPRSGFLIREWRQLRWTRWWLARVISFSDAVVCQGLRWREFFSAITGRDSTQFPIIYNIVSLPDLASIALPCRERAEQILLMGWVERNKGIFDLVDIVERFRPELLGVRFLVCGNGRDWNALSSEIEIRNLQDMFELRGWVDEVGKAKVMSEVDACLMLSHHEGMPNSLIEAMANARPVVATAVGAVPDIVVDGKTGFLCEPCDIEEIGFRIVELVKSRSQREQIGFAGRNMILSKMSRDVVWRDWMSVIIPTQPGAPTSIVGKREV